jgi:hypothetical protein
LGGVKGLLGGRLLKDEANPPDPDLVARPKEGLLYPLSIDPGPISAVEVAKDEALGGPLDGSVEPGDLMVRQMEGVGGVSAQGKGRCDLIGRSLKQARPCHKMRCRQDDLLVLGFSLGLEPNIQKK